MLLEYMTMKDFKRHLKHTQTVILPFGTVEEHGNHLPLNTDTLIIYEILKLVVKKRKVFLAPPVFYGVCTTTSQHPGTLSITPDTLRRIANDLIRESYKDGLRNIFLISGHGGGLHMSALKEVGEQLVEELKGINIAVFSPYDVLHKELADIADTPNDSHAGELETSMVLALAPELVKGRSKEDYPKMPRPFIAGNKLQYWRSGIWGNPEKASQAKGEEAVKLIVNKVVEILDMVKEKKL